MNILVVNENVAYLDTLSFPLTVVIQDSNVMLHGFVTPKQGTLNCHDLPKPSIKICLDILNVTLIQKMSSETLYRKVGLKCTVQGFYYMLSLRYCKLNETGIDANWTTCYMYLFLYQILNSSGYSLAHSQ
jgi:hypothetical protein